MMHLTIGQLAKKAKMNPRTIRYYEGVGLVPQARRNESGYRLYTEDEVARLEFIRRARLLGLSLQEAKEVVEYASTGRCLTLEGHLHQLLNTKIAKVEAQIVELGLLREEMQALCDSLKERIDVGRGGKAGTLCTCLAKPGDDSSRPI